MFAGAVLVAAVRPPMEHMRRAIESVIAKRIHGVVDSQANRVHAETALGALAHRGWMLDYSTGAAHASVVETKAVHHSVAVKEMERAVTRGRKYLLGRTVTVESAVKLARHLAFDPGNLVNALGRRWAPAIRPGHWRTLLHH